MVAVWVIERSNFSERAMSNLLDNHGHWIGPVMALASGSLSLYFLVTAPI